MTERIGIGAFSAIGEAALFEWTSVQASKGTSVSQLQSTLVSTAQFSLGHLYCSNKISANRVVTRATRLILTPWFDQLIKNTVLSAIGLAGVDCMSELLHYWGDPRERENNLLNIGAGRSQFFRSWFLVVVLNPLSHVVTASNSSNKGRVVHRLQHTKA